MKNGSGYIVYIFTEVVSVWSNSSGSFVKNGSGYTVYIFIEVVSVWSN